MLTVHGRITAQSSLQVDSHTCLDRQSCSHNSTTVAANHHRQPSTLKPNHRQPITTTGMCPRQHAMHARLYGQILWFNSICLMSWGAIRTQLWWMTHLAGRLSDGSNCAYSSQNGSNCTCSSQYCNFSQMGYLAPTTVTSWLTDCVARFEKRLTLRTICLWTSMGKCLRPTGCMLSSSSCIHKPPSASVMSQPCVSHMSAMCQPCVSPALSAVMLQCADASCIINYQVVIRL